MIMRNITYNPKLHSTIVSKRVCNKKETLFVDKQGMKTVGENAQHIMMQYVGKMSSATGITNYTKEMINIININNYMAFPHNH
jgi:hypothetical protein